MCVMSLLSKEKQLWLQNRLEVYGHTLDLNKGLSEQIQNLPQSIIEQLSLDVSVSEMCGYQSWCLDNLTLFKSYLDKVRKEELTPANFQALMVEFSERCNQTAAQPAV